MKNNTLTIAGAAQNGEGHIICKDGLEFDLRPLTENAVILHHIEKDGKLALNNRVKMLIKDAEVFVKKKHKGIQEITSPKYVSMNSDELANPDAYEDAEEEYVDEEAQTQENGSEYEYEENDESSQGEEEWEENDQESDENDDEDLFDDEESNENGEIDFEEDDSFNDDDSFEEEGSSEEEDSFEENTSEEQNTGNEYDWDDEDETPQQENDEEPLNTGEDNFSGAYAENRSNTESIIADDMIVMGDIISKSSVEISGGVDGSITAMDRVVVAGGVNGDIIAGSDAILNNNSTNEATEVRGSITAQGNIIIDEKCVVLGNISAQGAVIKGSVLGDADIKGKLTLCSRARVKGNITAKEIEVETGALIEGNCMLTYAESTADKFFKEYASRLENQQTDVEQIKKSITSISKDVTMKELL